MFLLQVSAVNLNGLMTSIVGWIKRKRHLTPNKKKQIAFVPVNVSRTGKINFVIKPTKYIQQKQIMLAQNLTHIKIRGSSFLKKQTIDISYSLPPHLAPWSHTYYLPFCFAYRYKHLPVKSSCMEEPIFLGNFYFSLNLPVAGTVNCE